ncbi:hypothetical protein JCM19000A_25430 [Silvimonas sp. JCM 19000]
MDKEALRAALCGIVSNLTPVILNRDMTVYLRATTVGAVNFDISLGLAHMLKLAEQQGVPVDLDDWPDVDKLKAFLRRRVGDPFMLARRLAVRLCDEAGELLFDASNEDDLKAINALDGSVLDVLRVELDRETAAKNSAPGDASSSS